MSTSLSSFTNLVDNLQHHAEAQGDKRACTFLEDGERRETVWSYGDLDRRARSVAAALQERIPDGARPQERALLLYAPGLDYIAAFFGCLYARVLAVPAYPPHPGQSVDRILSIVDDAAPVVALTTANILKAVQPFIAQYPALARVHWIATDTLSEGTEAGWRRPDLDGDTLAFLQYTSGSTATPRGVMVSHGNLVANHAMIRRGFDHDENTCMVGWLPLYHDMGLIGNVLHPIFLGVPTVLMSPWSFLQRPARWLWAISRYRATTSGGPNFGYALCTRKVKPEQREELDLSSWRVAYNGAEPVRHETLQRFAESFAPQGFQAKAFYPCYGLAEATLFVSGGVSSEPPRVAKVAAEALERDAFDPAQTGSGKSRTLVSCGRAWSDEGRIAIVEPESGMLLPDGQVGEIWVSGPHVSRGGYWNAEEKNAETFQATLAGAKGERFLRTGDLGVLRGGELYVTGRIKDMVIIEGRNHYAQDLEQTIETAITGLRPGNIAAFSIDEDGEERVVIVAEVDRRYRPADAPEGGDEPRLDRKAAAQQARRVLSSEHGLPLHELLLVQPDQMPKTSSGKLQRRACRALYQGERLRAW